MLLAVSEYVKGVDTAFAVIIGISLVFLVGITFFMILFVVKYNRKRHPKAKQIKENSKLELLWTIVPTILVLIMFYYGWVEYAPSRNVPEGAITVKTTGRMWSWSFEYENGKTNNDILYMPVNQPVKLELFSPDVLHSFYVPAFRIKEDVVPGKDNYMWFESNETGEFDILCAEYCGARHAYMLGKVRVVSQEEFDEWLNKDVPDEEEAEPVGYQVLKKNACVSCHSTDGSVIIGPSFKNLFGEETEVEDQDGNELRVTVDASYIKSSIYEPGKHIVKGFPKGLMVSYKNQVTEEEINEIIEYLKTLHD